MKIKRIAVIELCILVLLPGSIFAARVEVKGIGTYYYKGGIAFPSNQPREKEKQAATELAKTNAWKNFVASLNVAKQQAIFAHEKEVLQQLDQFIIDVVLIDMYKEKDSRTLSVVVRVAFNDEVVSQLLERLSLGGASVARSKDSLFAFLFIARKATSVTQFDARRTDVVQTEISSDGDAAELTSTNKRAVGGSTLQKMDVSEYAVSSSQDLDAAMGEILTTAGIEYVGYDDIVAGCGAPAVASFRSEFVESDELLAATRSAIISAARSNDCNVKYFAYGTVDSDIPGVDGATGLRRVFVSVRSQLWDISRKLPRKIDSVGPKQYFGLGPDFNVASRNAIAAAARDLARTLVDQLNSKGIR